MNGTGQLKRETNSSTEREVVQIKGWKNYYRFDESVEKKIIAYDKSNSRWTVAV